MVKHVSTIPPWFPLASAILTAAIAEEHKSVGEMIRKIDAQYAHQWPEIIYTWIDALLSSQGIRPTDYGRPHLTQVDVDYDTGETNPDQTGMTDPQRWTSALVRARSLDDKDAYYDLLNQVSADTAHEYVGTLITSCAATIRVAMAAHNEAEAEREGGISEH